MASSSRSSPRPLERKLAIMGYRSVGKSTLTMQYVEDRFVDSYDPTIENTFTKQTRIRNLDFNLFLVDTAGQDEYSIMPNRYSIDVHGYLMVYAINSQKSFDVLKVIYEKLFELCAQAPGISKIPMVLVANKSDLTLEREVSGDAGRALAKTWDVPFYEVTARDNDQSKVIYEKLLYEVDRLAGNLPVEPPNRPCSMM